MADNRFGVDEEFVERQREIYKSSYISIALLVINIIVFVLSNTIARFLYSEWVMDTTLIVRDGEFYRLFSAIFMHLNMDHLFNNMMVLLLVGALIENYLGHFAYFFLYIIAGTFGNLLSMYYEINSGDFRISLGASGATMGIVGFLVVWLVINRKTLVKDRSMIFRLLLLLLLVINACFFQPQANTQAHLGGFIAGFIFGLINIVIFKNRKNMEGIV